MFFRGNFFYKFCSYNSLRNNNVIPPLKAQLFAEKYEAGGHEQMRGSGLAEKRWRQYFLSPGHHLFPRPI